MDLKRKAAMEIRRRDSNPRDPLYSAWEMAEGDKRYWVGCRRTSSGPVWTASVFVEPAGDRKPHWRALRNWQKFACAAREFECQSQRNN